MNVDELAPSLDLYDTAVDLVLQEPNEPLLVRSFGRTDPGRVMRHSIALNGSFFNAQRMIMQYLQNAYLPADRSADSWVRWEKP